MILIPLLLLLLLLFRSAQRSAQVQVLSRSAPLLKRLVRVDIKANEEGPQLEATVLAL